MITHKSIDELIETIWLQETIDFSLPSLKEYCYPDSSLWDFKKFFKYYLGKIIRIAEIKESAAVEAAFHNSIMYGNKKDTGLPLKVKVFKGLKGVVIQIEDSGEGFDFKETQRKWENGETYYQNGGNGWKFFNRPYVQVSFEGKGNIINLAY